MERVRSKRPSQIERPSYYPSRTPMKNRSSRRRDLIRAALEEFHRGHDSITALYSAMLVRGVVAADPDLRQYAMAVEEALGCDTGGLEQAGEQAGA